jgi:hypothetical protein
MELLAQDVLVGLIVAACALFSAWRLMSPGVRLRALTFLAPALGKLGAGGAMERLRSRTIGQLASGCSACSHHKNAVSRPHSGRG